MKKFFSRDKVRVLTSAILVVLVASFLHRTYLYMKSANEKALEELRGELEITKIETYYTKTIPVAQTDIKFQDIDEDTIGFVSDGDFNRISCGGKLQLKDPDVIRYNTEASKGLITSFEGYWYIANVSQKFSKKEDVIAHIKACEEKAVSYVDNELKALRENENKNLKSWGK